LSGPVAGNTRCFVAIQTDGLGTDLAVPDNIKLLNRSSPSFFVDHCNSTYDCSQWFSYDSL